MHPEISLDQLNPSSVLTQFDFDKAVCDPDHVQVCRVLVRARVTALMALSPRTAFEL